MKDNNFVYCLQISALVSKIFKFKKCVKYANEMTDGVIHSTQFCSGGLADICRKEKETYELIFS